MIDNNPRSCAYVRSTANPSCALAHDLHARWRGAILIGDSRCRAILDAGGWVPAEHGVHASKLGGKDHLGALAALRLVDGAGVAAHLAEAARVSVGRHWAGSPVQREDGVT